MRRADPLHATGVSGDSEVDDLMWNDDALAHLGDLDARASPAHRDRLLPATPAGTTLPARRRLVRRQP